MKSPTGKYEEDEIDEDYCDPGFEEWSGGQLLLHSLWDENLRFDAESETKFSAMLERRPAGCRCEVGSFVTPDLSTGEWLHLFNTTEPVT